MTRKELESLYIRLNSDNTDLSNIKAIEKVKGALELVSSLEKYKHGFFLLALLSFFVLASLFFYLIKSYSYFQHIKKISYYNVTPSYNYKRVIIKRRIDKIKQPTTQDKKIKFLGNKISYLNPGVDTEKVASLIVQLASIEQIDPFIVAAIIHSESNFNHKARSRVGALGLMQIMPTTANLVRSKKHLAEELHCPKYNIELGITYFKQLLSRFGGNFEQALMAYNWGPENVSKVLKNKKNFNPAVKRYARNVTSIYSKWKKEFEYLYQL